VQQKNKTYFETVDCRKVYGALGNISIKRLVAYILPVFLDFCLLDKERGRRREHYTINGRFSVLICNQKLFKASYSTGSDALPRNTNFCSVIVDGARHLRHSLVAAFVLALFATQAFAQAACTVGEMIEHNSVYYQDFGTGSARSSDPNVLNHNFVDFGAGPSWDTNAILDDNYAVGTSASLSVSWMQTDAIGGVDADGNTNGRYLGINMRGTNEPSGSWVGEFYRVNNITLAPTGLPTGATVGGFRFSTALVGTAFGAEDVPNFTLLIEDGSSAAPGPVLASGTSASFGVANNDTWVTASVEVSPVPSSVTSANVVLFNSQPEGSDGNDVGVDNINLAPLLCLPPTLDFTKSATFINNVVGDPATTQVGDTIRYTFSLTNNSTTTAYNVSLTETTFTGAGTAPTPFVLSGAADLDGGNGTNTDVAPGQTLVFQADYTITQDDFVAGNVDNQARADFEDLAATNFSILSDGDTGTAGQQITTVQLTADIAPAADSGAATSGTASTAVADVTVGDTVNGAAVDLTAGTGNATIAEVGTWPVGFSLDPASGEIAYDGTSVLPGDYTMTYELCDLASPANCAPATVTVSVGSDIAPGPDSGAATSGTASTAVADVTAGDTVNGAAVDLDPTTGNATIAEVGTWPVGFSLDPATGEIAYDGTSVLPGDYTMDYTLCDLASPANCAPATVTVSVGATPIDAVDDTPAPINGAVGGDVGNVLTGDTLDGDPATLDTVDITDPVAGNYTDADGNQVTGLMLDPTTGVASVAPGTLDGTYTVVYEICEEFNLNNCASATMTVVVRGEPPVASDDSVTPTEPGPVTIDPLSNDSRTDDQLDPTSVVFTGTGAPAGSTLSSDGKVLTVQGEGEWSINRVTGLVTFTPEAGFSGAATPAAYTVSDVFGRTSNVGYLSVTVLAAVEIIANNDGPFALDGTRGGTSAESVLANDTLDGSPITDPSLVTFTTVSQPSLLSGSIALNPDGTVTVAPDTTPGTYTLVYEICETSNPTNCATAEVELIVVDTGTGLINEIEDDLETILEEDLAITLTMLSGQISSYSADALDRLRARGHDNCLADVNARLAVESILFDTGKASIKPESYPTLDGIAAILISCTGSSFEIAGHTDSDASDAYNLDLSQRRVVAVRQALAQRGVDTTGYVARGYGESQPIASNATQEGKARNRRVEFRPLGGADGYQGPCDDNFSLVRSLDANANDDGVIAEGQFVRDQYDCITDRREVFDGSISYSDTEQGQTQSAINLSYRQEQYRGNNSVFGYFAGLYGTQSDVTRLADGEIRGIGLNAGIYGANRLDADLYVDYYLGAAAGRHEFDLAFARDIGAINAAGDYQYFAGFAGAALSGEVEAGDTTLVPRIGFDYVYTPGANVDVVAELSGLSEVGNFELDAISGGRVFAEVRMDQLVDRGQANLWFNPRVACYQSIGSLDGVCGFGGSIGIESIGEDSDLNYSFEASGEWGQDYSIGSFSAGVARQIGIGALSGTATMSTKGSATLGGIYEIEF